MQYFLLKTGEVSLVYMYLHICVAYVLQVHETARNNFKKFDHFWTEIERGLCCSINLFLVWFYEDVLNIDSNIV